MNLLLALVHVILLTRQSNNVPLYNLGGEQGMENYKDSKKPGGESMRKQTQRRTIAKS